MGSTQTSGHAPGQPLTISPEQQLMLGLASGNKTTTSVQGKFQNSLHCVFLSWYRETHTPNLQESQEKYRSLAPHHIVHGETAMLADTAYCRLFSHSTPHNLVPYLYFAQKEQATLNSIRNESRSHSNEWGDSKSPDSPLGNNRSSS